MNFKNLLLIAALFSVVQSGFASVNIFIQPQNQAVALGSNAVFTASTTTTSGETITGYTWLVSTNSAGPFSTISGATGPVLTIANAQFNNSGFYFVRVNYQSGGNPGIAVSTAVTLSVQDQARVTSQPAGLIRGAGGTASFMVTAEGEAPLGFQWRLNGTKLNNNGRISGVNSASLTVSNLSMGDAGNYDVVVTNSYSSATSHVAALTILLPPAITVPPVNTTVVVGNTATLSVVATGSAPLNYRWRKNGVNLPNSGRFSGVTNDTLVITGTLTNDTGLYSVFVTNAVGSTNASATLTIVSPPIFTSATNVVGRQGLPLNFKLTASGSAPITFGSEELPNGLSLNSTNGQISGTPIVSGIFPVTVFASNVASNAVGIVTFTITTGAPGIISPLTAQTKQGELFTYSIFASNNPVSFSASELPTGLNLDSASGLISGNPLTNGVFIIAIGASNEFGADSKDLTLTIATSVPGITSPLGMSGKQGEPFTYTIVASNNPVSFSASGLPLGLNFDSVTGVISGAPIEQGLFPVVIGASNQFGVDQQILLLDLATAAPVITSPLVISANEGETNFSYTIQASNSPKSFSATGLPLGLVINPLTGVISGTAALGGTNDVVISARNIWGVGSSTLQIQIANVAVTNLFITDVTWTYSAPYLLDFTFSLRDNLDPALGRAVVRPIDQVRVVCNEGDLAQHVFTRVGNETAVVLSPGITANAKQLKTFFVMDYTYSMLIASNAIPQMESAVKALINEEPSSAQFAINEFNADYVDPALVSDFTSDKALLRQAIDGIQTNFVQGNYAGSRLYDALSDAIAQFGPENKDEQRYVVLTSDGHDDASLTTLGPVILNAIAARVQIYCVGFGTNVNTGVLQQLALATGGRYFSAASAEQIPAQFALLLKDLNAQYFLRWATLRRGAAFQPMFAVTVDGVTARYNPDFPEEVEDDSVVPQTTPPTMKTVKIDRSTTPPTTNDPSVFAPDFDPNSFTNNVQIGELRLVTDAATNVSSVMLRAFYVPRYVREILVHYRANYPCTPLLMSAAPGEVLAGWTLSETNDGTGTNGNWLRISSPEPTNVLTSLPYGFRGDLVKFQFQPQAVTDPQHAFSLFEIDNTVYTNSPPSGQSFTLTNTNSLVTFFEATPPHGTPVPWLVANGFTNDFTNAELSDPNGNGLPVWQEYLAGLNPNDPNSTLAIRVEGAMQPGSTNHITFSTVVGKKYRVESAVKLGAWNNLIDDIPGTGGEVTVEDDRNLSGLSTIFYRIAVY